MLKLLLTAALLAAGGAAQAQQETVTFKTSDGCRLEAFYLAPSSSPFVFINTHGLGSSKNEWDLFQEELKKLGFGYLSLDLRGHNASQSCGGKKTDYKKFSKEDWNKASLDIEAAAGWLNKKGVSPASMVFCGASIGANLSLKAAVEGQLKPAALILLSPGLEYAGVGAEEYFSSPWNFKILVSAAGNDPYAWQSSMKLVKSSGGKARPADFVNGGSGHGVNMLKNPRVTSGILRWASKL